MTKRIIGVALGIVLATSVATSAALAQGEQRGPIVRLPQAMKPAAPSSAAAAGATTICVTRLNYREQAGLTAANGNGRIANGQEVAFFFTASGGVIVLGTANAIVPPTTNGWVAEKTNNLLDLIATAAANRRPVTVEYGSSSGSQQPITGVQLSPGEADCAF